MIIRLDFPSSDLSANERGEHWSGYAKAAKRYRRDCWALCLSQTTARDRALIGSDGDRIDVHLEFFRPHKFRYDKDGLLTRMKSGLDGIADALHVNDYTFNPTFDIAKDTGNYVLVTLSPSQPP